MTYPSLPVTPLPRAPAPWPAPGLLESPLALARAPQALQGLQVAAPLLAPGQVPQHATAYGDATGNPPDTAHRSEHYST